jgi:hypothetical protein
MVKQRLYFVLTLKHTILSSTIEQKALTILYFQTRTHPNERPNVRRERPNDVAKLRLSSFSEPRVHWSIFMQSHWSTRTIKWPYLVMLTTLPSMDKAHASGGKVLPLYSKTFSQGKPSLHVAISFPEPAILGSQARGTRSPVVTVSARMEARRGCGRVCAKENERNETELSWICVLLWFLCCPVVFLREFTVDPCGSYWIPIRIQPQILGE